LLHNMKDTTLVDILLPLSCVGMRSLAETLMVSMEIVSALIEYYKRDKGHYDPL